MKLSELHRLVNLVYQPDQPHRDTDVVVVVKLPYTTIGGTPVVPIKQASSGFDWDSGKFMLWPEKNVQPADADFEKQFKDLQKKYGEADYENRGLKAEVRRLRKLLEKPNEST